jgi:hypothetical protein
VNSEEAKTIKTLKMEGKWDRIPEIPVNVPSGAKLPVGEGQVLERNLDYCRGTQYLRGRHGELGPGNCAPLVYKTECLIIFIIPCC